MPSIDDRVVSMTFDNKAFEGRMNTTLESLGKLKQSLQFDESTKNLQGLSAASSKFSLDGIGNAVENISGKFSAMGAVAFSVINNITTQALSAAERLVKGFTVAPIAAGFQEFETNANSIQTILANTASKGSTFEQVSASLNDLNTYSDQTIYNFSEMAKNIGTFTAAGVGLDESTRSIKGIANLAALSGSNSQQASSAMYQLSQAMAAGSLHAQDWISVVNSGMGGEAFKSSLFEAAKALHKLDGVPIDQTYEQWTKAGGNFKDEMSNGTFTADVLSLSLQGFTGDMDKATLITKGYSAAQADAIIKQAATAKGAATEVKTFTQLIGTVKESVGTGWADTFQVVIGNFYEAKQLFTGVNNVISSLVTNSATSRNNLLGAWKAFGGREALIQSIRNVLASVFLVIQNITKGFRDVFPKTTAAQLLTLTAAIKDFTSHLIPSADTLEKLRSIARGVFSVLSIGAEIVKVVIGVFAKLTGAAAGLVAPGLLTFFAGLGDKLYALQQVLVANGGIENFVQGLADAISNFVAGLDLGTKLQPFLDWIQALWETFSGFFDSGVLAKVSLAFTTMKEAIQAAFSGDSSIPGLELIKNALFQVKDIILSIFGKGSSANMDGLGEATGRIGERFSQLSAIVAKLGEFMDWLGKKFSEGNDQFKGFTDAVGPVIHDFFAKIADAFKNGDFSNIFDALNIGLFGGIVLALNKFLKKGINFNFDVGQGLFKKIKGSFDELTNTMKAMQTQIKAEALQKIAIAIGILTASVLVLSLIDSVKLTAALVAMAAGFGELVGTMAILNKISSDPKSSGNLAILSGVLIAFTGAIFILSIAMKLLSTIDPSQMAASTATIGALLGMIVLTMKTMPKTGDMIGAGLGIAGLAFGITQLAFAVKVFGSMSLTEMATGLGGMVVSLAAVTIAMKHLDGKHMTEAGIGIAILSVGLTIMAGAVRLFATMSMDNMIQGLVGIGATLAILAITMKLMPSNLPMIGLGLNLIGIGLIVISGAVAILGSMDLTKLATGIGAIAVILLILGVASDSMVQSLPGALAILVISGALIVLYGAISLFGSMDLKTLAIGIGAIAVAILALLGITIIVGAAATLFSEATPFILAMGAALLVLGLGLSAIALAGLIFAGSIYLIALAIQVLATVGADGVDKFIEVLPRLTIAVVEAILKAIQTFLDGTPELIAAFGKVLDAILNLIITNAPKIGEALGAISSAFATFITDHAPELILAGLVLFTTFLQGINDNIEQITILVGGIIVKFLEALNQKMPDIIVAGAVLLITFLYGIADNIGAVIDAGYSLIVAVVNGIASNIGKLADAGGNLIIQFIYGIGSNMIRVASAGVDVIIAFINALADNSLRLVNAAADALITFLNGIATAIRTKGREIEDAGSNVAGAVVDAITGAIGRKIKDALGPIGFIFGSIIDKVKEVFHIQSPSKVFYGIASNVAAGFVNGLMDDTTAGKSATRFGEDIKTKLQDALMTASMAIENMNEFNPTITPVIDLTNIEEGALRMSSIIGTPVIDTTASFGQASSIAVATSTSVDTVPVKTITDTQPIQFNQTINSPKELAAADIYRNTRSQLALAKEKLTQ